MLISLVEDAMFKGAYIAVTAIVLGGCQGGVPVVSPMLVPVEASIAMVSLPQTKKLPTDHLISAMTGQDCSMIQYEQSGQYCRENRQVDNGKIYCIKTLGSVECHRRADPYYGGESILGSPPIRLVGQ